MYVKIEIKKKETNKRSQILSRHFFLIMQIYGPDSIVAFILDLNKINLDLYRRSILSKIIMEKKKSKFLKKCVPFATR